MLDDSVYIKPLVAFLSIQRLNAIGFN